MLDYTQRKKNFLSVKLIDGTRLLLKSPTKALFTKINAFKQEINDDNPCDLYDEIAALCAEILSNNMNQHDFNADYITEIMDYEDMACLIYEYSQYMNNIVKNPN